MPLKNLIPSTIRRRLQMSRRSFRDRAQGWAFAQKSPSILSTSSTLLPFSHVLRQNILNADTNFSKVENIRLASQMLSAVVVQPDEVLSSLRYAAAVSPALAITSGRALGDGFGGVFTVEATDPECGFGLEVGESVAVCDGLALSRRSTETFGVISP